MEAALADGEFIPGEALHCLFFNGRVNAVAFHFRFQLFQGGKGGVLHEIQGAGEIGL